MPGILFPMYLLHLLALASAACLIAGCSPQRTPGGQVSSVVPSAPASSAPVPTSAPASASAAQAVETIAENLSIPWAIAFLPNGDMLVTERPGTLLRLAAGGSQRYPIAGVRHRGEGGLLGVVAHPRFTQNGWIYLYLTSDADGPVRNRVDRYRLTNDELTERTVILDDIPAATNHDGGALAFGPDGMLYVTTGDAGTTANARDTSSLAGKILRVRDDGSIPGDNPFGNAVYSSGHRNVQGIAWDASGNLWATEHGRSGALSGYDELNRIERGADYGWPTIQGSETAQNLRAPALHSGPTTTWAPASAAYLDGKILFGGLKGQSLYAADIANPASPVLTAHFAGEYGRIRAVTVGPDGFLYVTTSNTDGRGSPAADDDRILRVDPAVLR
jgi:aldose sugar dehydrogenase